MRDYGIASQYPDAPRSASVMGDTDPQIFDVVSRRLKCPTLGRLGTIIEPYSTEAGNGMKAKIPITQRIIKAARYSDFKGGPLALAILLKLSDLQEVLVGEEILTLVREEGQSEEYTILDCLDGWLQYFYMGEKVPAGTLRLGTLTRRGGMLEEAASLRSATGNLVSWSILGAGSVRVKVTEWPVGASEIIPGTKIARRSAL